MRPQVTHTSVYTVTVPANPYLRCSTCHRRVEGFLDEPGPISLIPCEHRADYYDVCPSWGPVDGCCCMEHLGERSHGDPPPAKTEYGERQGPI